MRISLPVKYLMAKVLHACNAPGFVRPFKHRDASGQLIEIRTSPRYTVLSVGGAEYFFDRESGRFDGIGGMSLDDGVAPTYCRAVRTQQ